MTVKLRNFSSSLLCKDLKVLDCDVTSDDGISLVRGMLVSKVKHAAATVKVDSLGELRPGMTAYPAGSDTVISEIYDYGSLSTRIDCQFKTSCPVKDKRTYHSAYVPST